MKYHQSHSFHEVALCGKSELFFYLASSSFIFLFFSQSKYLFPGFFSGLNKLWRRRREKNFMEEKVRRRQNEIGGKPWRGGKKEKEFMPLKFKMFPESEVLPHGRMWGQWGTTDVADCPRNERETGEINPQSKSWVRTVVVFLEKKWYLNYCQTSVRPFKVAFPNLPIALVSLLSRVGVMRMVSCPRLQGLKPQQRYLQARWP